MQHTKYYNVTRCEFRAKRDDIKQNAYKGDPIAMYEIGMISVGCNKTIYNKSWKRRGINTMIWFAKSAELGYAPAMYELGIQYLMWASSTPAIRQCANKWLIMSADNMYDLAINFLPDLKKRVTMWSYSNKCRTSNFFGRYCSIIKDYENDVNDFNFKRNKIINDTLWTIINADVCSIILNFTNV
jgi:hypothetical protein